MLEVMFYSKGTKPYGKNTISNWAEVCFQDSRRKVKKTFITITEINKTPVFMDVFDSMFFRIRKQKIAEIIEENPTVEAVLICNGIFFNQLKESLEDNEDDIQFIMFENGMSFNYIMLGEDKSILLFAED